MAETQTWRIDTGDRVREVVVTRTEHGAWADPDGHLGASARIAVQAWAYRNSVMGAILAPNEPTRAELAAQLAAVTAERDVALEECSTLRRGLDHTDDVIDLTRAALGAADDEGAVVAAQRVTRELAVLRAQQAPLVACVDALRAAATSAVWRDADATGEHLVAWVRRGALLDAARIAMERGGEWVARAIVARVNEEWGAM